jgi:hypothetical protein
VLIHVEFPISDLRNVFGNLKQLPNPSWPIPIPEEEFVRSFGTVRRRRRGGLSGWVGEGHYCDAKGALILERLNYENKSFPDPLSDFRPAFRRLYADGLALAKIDVGLTGHIRRLNLDWTNVLDALEKIIVRVSKSHGVTSIFESQAYLTKLYERSTSRISRGSPYTPSGCVHSEQPIVFIEVRAHERSFRVPSRATSFTFEGDETMGRTPTWLPSGGYPQLWHWWTNCAGREVPVWCLQTVSNTGSVETAQFQRELRLILLRLHAERVILRRALKSFSAEPASHFASEEFSDRVQHFFNVAIRRTLRLEKHGKVLGVATNKAEFFAYTFLAAISPGELEGVEQKISSIRIRHHVKAKIVQYAKSITINSQTISQEIIMGDKNINNGQAVNVGRSNTASGFTQQQIINADADKLSDELEQLIHHLKRTIDSAEQEVAVEQLERAREAVHKNQEGKVNAYLKSAGTWALKAAESLALPLLSEAIKKAIGM